MRQLMYIDTDYELDTLLKAMGYYAAENPCDRFILEALASQVDNNICMPSMSQDCPTGFAPLPQKFTTYRRSRKLNIPLPRTEVLPSRRIKE